MSEVPTSETLPDGAPVERPTYVVMAAEQESAWHLHVELPGLSIGRVFDDMNHPGQVTKDMRKLIGVRLGVPDDSFDLRVVWER